MEKIEERTITFRVDPEMAERIEAVAASEYRTMSSYLRWLINEDFKRRVDKFPELPEQVE